MIKGVIDYDSENDILFMHIGKQKTKYCEEINRDVRTDHLEDGSIIGIEIENATKHIKEILNALLASETLMLPEDVMEIVRKMKKRKMKK